MRFGPSPERAAVRNEVGKKGSDSGSAGCSPLMASSSSARSSTLRAIGPCTVRLRSILATGVCASGRSRQVPRVERRTEHLVEGIGAGAEFRRIGFGIDHGAVMLESFDHDVGVFRDRILEDRRALRVLYALDIEQVFYRNS